MEITFREVMFCYFSKKMKNRVFKVVMGCITMMSSLFFIGYFNEGSYRDVTFLFLMSIVVSVVSSYFVKRKEEADFFSGRGLDSHVPGHMIDYIFSIKGANTDDLLKVLSLKESRNEVSLSDLYCLLGESKGAFDGECQ